MKYIYEDMSDTQFEEFIVLLCQKLFGISVQGFAKGPDGGRDGKFNGTAERFPSKAEPWKGITIIQAKHTNGTNQSFSDSKFYSPSSKNTVIGKEIPRIKKLREEKNLDHYILFSNRRLTANTENNICGNIAEECGIPEQSIHLCGLEQIESLLKEFPDVPEKADLDPIDSPLIISHDDLAEVVEALASQKKDGVFLAAADSLPLRVSYEKKNIINKMTDAYAMELRKKYLKETKEIQAFLAAPENAELQYLYNSVIDEFQFKIIANRKDYQTFDKVMEYLLDLLFNRDAVLRRHRRLTRAVLFYMYWICDIGETGDA